MPTPSSSAPQSPRATGGRNVTPYPSALRGGHYRSQSLMSDTASPTSGSMTQTVTSPGSPFSPDGLVLRLRGHHDPSTTIDGESSTNSSRSSFGSIENDDLESGGSMSPVPRGRRRITWAEDVIDNEGLGRKSSKVCCIYHKAREFGESSSEDDNSSTSDSDSDASQSPDDGAARMASSKKGRRGHKHGKDCAHGHGRGNDKAKKRTPNAYEKMPKYNPRPADVKS